MATQLSPRRREKPFHFLRLWTVAIPMRIENLTAALGRTNSQKSGGWLGRFVLNKQMKNMQCDKLQATVNKAGVWLSCFHPGKAGLHSSRERNKTKIWLVCFLGVGLRMHRSRTASNWPGSFHTAHFYDIQSKNASSVWANKAVESNTTRPHDPRLCPRIWSFQCKTKQFAIEQRARSEVGAGGKVSVCPDQLQMVLLQEDVCTGMFTFCLANFLHGQPSIHIQTGDVTDFLCRFRGCGCGFPTVASETAVFLWHKPFAKLLRPACMQNSLSVPQDDCPKILCCRSGASHFGQPDRKFLFGQSSRLNSNPRSQTDPNPAAWFSPPKWFGSVFYGPLAGLHPTHS